VNVEAARSAWFYRERTSRNVVEKIRKYKLTTATRSLPEFLSYFLIFTVASVLSYNFYSRPTFLLCILFGHFANSSTSRSFFIGMAVAPFAVQELLKRGGLL
jgi:hypothetical protein